jgi:hypothetical protein
VERGLLQIIFETCMEHNAPSSCTTKELDAPTTTEACFECKICDKKLKNSDGDIIHEKNPR